MSTAPALSAEETAWLAHAVQLAAQAHGQGDPPFGSLLVDGEGTLLAEAVNTTTSDDDITAHPELKLARWAASALDLPVRRGATLITSCQPCSMCEGALLRAGVGRVIYALSTARLAELKDPAAPSTQWPHDLVGPYPSREGEQAVSAHYSPPVR